MSNFVSSVVLLLVIRARDRSAHPNMVFSLSLLPEPLLGRTAYSSWWAPRPGMGSLLNLVFSLEPWHLSSFTISRLLFLAVLRLGAPLDSFLEEALYKWSICLMSWSWGWSNWSTLKWIAEDQNGTGIDHRYHPLSLSFYRWSFWNYQ